MIERIVVVLDPDDDIPVATKYTIRLAKRFAAILISLAIADKRNIYAVITLGGYGTELHGYKIWS